MFFPRRYRMSLIIGIAVGFSQGIITVFFETFVCALADKGTARLYCREQLYDPSTGFLALTFLNILSIGPTLLFLFKFEKFGRAKILLYGTIATIIMLVLTQVFSRGISQKDYFDWYVYVVQVIIILYVIFIYSASLGPVLYFSYP